MNVHRTILTGAVLLAVTAVAAPAKATTLDLALGTLASLGTPVPASGGAPSTFSAEFSGGEVLPGAGWGYQGGAVSSSSIGPGGAINSNYASSPTGVSDFTFGFSWTPANNGTFTSFGTAGEGGANDYFTDVSLYQGSSLIESASIYATPVGGGSGLYFSNYTFDPILVVAGSNYTLDVTGSVGPTSGWSELGGQINIASAKAPGAVPLPASFPLFLTAILALMGFAAVKRVRENS